MLVILSGCDNITTGENATDVSVAEMTYSDMVNVLGKKRAHFKCEGNVTNYKTTKHWKKCKLEDKLDKKEYTQFPCALSCFETAIGF
ncbi:unnamed protein product, partial [Allacma fusca]